MSDVRQRGLAWGLAGAAGGAGAAVINNHKPADARTSRGATPASGNEESLIMFYWTVPHSDVNALLQCFSIIVSHLFRRNNR